MKTAQLSEVAQLDYGFAFDSKLFNTEGRGLPLVRIRDVVRGWSDTYYSGDYTDRYIVNDGDYLIGMDGQFNLARWRGGKALLNQRVCRIGALDASLDRTYLARFMPRALKAIEDSTPFVTVKHLSAKALNAIRVPLPPLPEQRRIAAILDQADALRAKRRQVLTHLEEALPSLFAETLAGSDHNSVPLAEAAEIWDCPHSTPKWTESGAVCLRTPNLTAGGWNWEDTRFVDEEQFGRRSKGGGAQPGDIILSREGTVGIAAIVQPGMRVCMGQRLVQVRPRTDSLLPEWALAYLLTALHPSRIAQAMVGSTAQHLNVKDLRALPVPIPSLKVQRGFADRAAQVARGRATVARAHTADDELFSSLQSRAFRGEL
ncbi:restriction endonuclease subunit S [Georgenia halophila]|uniref:Restriction endonuclease subunit S n=1 Tax=Georgenia halophila TaxID=620889 RepID=A0ABP8LLF2_9MICO